MTSRMEQIADLHDALSILKWEWYAANDDERAKAIEMLCPADRIGVFSAARQIADMRQAVQS